MINWSPVISSSWEIIRNFEHNSAHFEVRKVNWQSGDGVKARLLLLSFKLISGRDKIKFFCSSAFDNSLLGKMVGASGCQLMFIWNQFGCKRIQCPRTSFKVILFGLTRDSKKFSNLSPFFIKRQVPVQSCRTSPKFLISWINSQVNSTPALGIVLQFQDAEAKELLQMFSCTFGFNFPIISNPIWQDLLRSQSFWLLPRHSLSNRSLQESPGEVINQMELTWKLS